MEDDADLARRAGEGDRDAFASLVRRHEGAVRRFLGRLTLGNGADDIAQDVFLKAWRMRGQQRGEGSYKAWIMRIAWTSFLETRRSAGRRLAREHASYEASQVASAGVTREARIDLARALEALDERERAAAQLCFAEGHSHGEAAAILGLPLGTLKSIAARAKAQLAAALGATE
jgi:RNA polymerase sigma-70 factor (ECF subfamily)